MYDQQTEAAEIKKESIIEREVNRLSQSTETVLIEAERLERRLMSVLQAQPKSTDDGTPREALGILAEGIRNNRERTDAAVYILKSIFSRLEI